MTVLDRIDGAVQEAVSRSAESLIGVSHWPDCSFVNLPMFYPDGSDVTVKVSRSSNGFRVTDNEFAFQAAVAHGLTGAAFVKVAERAVGDSLVKRFRRSFCMSADKSTLQSAIVEVAQVSWKTAHETFTPYHEVDTEDNNDDVLVERLIGLFGKNVVQIRPEIIGASTNHWRLTALVKVSETPAVFQNVSGSQYSVYKASSAFGDISDLDNAPKLVAVVDSKSALGTKLNLLSRTASVIERAQADETFFKAAA